MNRRVAAIWLSMTIGASACGCSPQAQQPQAANPSLPSVAQAVAGLGADATISTLDTRTIPGGRVAFVEVKTETTPTAAGVLDVLRATSAEYGEREGYIAVVVVTPGSGPGDRVRIDLDYNPTGSTIPTESARRALTPRLLLLSISRGDDVYHSSGQDRNIVLASDATTDALTEGGDRNAEIVARLRQRVPLR